MNTYDLFTNGGPQYGGLYKSPIGAWKVGGITDFSEIFSSFRNPYASAFNEDIQNWDTSDARSMEFMFYSKFGDAYRERICVSWYRCFRVSPYVFSSCVQLFLRRTFP